MNKLATVVTMFTLTLKETEDEKCCDTLPVLPSFCKRFFLLEPVMTFFHLLISQYFPAQAFSCRHPNIIEVSLKL